MPTMKSSSAPIGLVLSGGGAKGAYQAGVWNAMCESGLANRVKVISGTSVGAINGAAFAMLHDSDEVRRLWVERVGEVLLPNFKLLNYGKIALAISNAILGQPFPFLGIFSRSGLNRILRDVIGKSLDESVIEVYATALACNGDILQTLNPSAYSLKRFHLNSERSVTKIRKMILASAAIPWGFDPVEIDGTRYVDGGWEDNGGDNVPILPILENHPEIKTIYVVRCNSRKVEPETKTTFSNASRKVIEIRPQKPLPGIFDGLNIADNPKFEIWSGSLSFMPEFTKMYFDVGYADGKAVFCKDAIKNAKLNW